MRRGKQDKHVEGCVVKLHFDQTQINFNDLLRATDDVAHHVTAGCSETSRPCSDVDCVNGRCVRLETGDDTCRCDTGYTGVLFVPLHIFGSTKVLTTQSIFRSTL